MLMFQADVVSLLRSVARFGIWRLWAATNSTTADSVRAKPVRRLSMIGTDDRDHSRFCGPAVRRFEPRLSALRQLANPIPSGAASDDCNFPCNLPMAISPLNAQSYLSHRTFFLLGAFVSKPNSGFPARRRLPRRVRRPGSRPPVRVPLSARAILRPIHFL